MIRLTTLISCCLGAIVGQAIRKQDYYILAFAFVAFVANIVIACLI